MGVVYHEETVSDVNSLLNKAEEALQEGATDGLIILFDDRQLTFVGETQLFNDQIQMMISVLSSKYCDD